MDLEDDAMPHAYFHASASMGHCEVPSNAEIG